MHRQTLLALSWCLVLGAAAVVVLEVHRSHQAQPAVVVTMTTAETTITTTSPAIRSALREPTTLAYSANTKSRKFHSAGCKYASCPNCTAKFASREEAIAAGYHPGGCCDP